jgi:hypothetical protein
MLLFASVLLAAANVSAAPTGDMPVLDPRGSRPENCPATSRYEAMKRGNGPTAKKLAELPDADLYRTVYRRVGRCEYPIIVKFGVSGR